MQKQTAWGQTVVHDEVLAALAARAVQTVPGVVRTSHHRLPENLGNLVGTDASTRGIRVTELPDGHYTVEIHLVCAYGVKLAAIGRHVAEAVNKTLFEAVNLYPDQLAIHIQGIVRVD